MNEDVTRHATLPPTNSNVSRASSSTASQGWSRCFTARRRDRDLSTARSLRIRPDAGRAQEWETNDDSSLMICLTSPRRFSRSVASGKPIRFLQVRLAASRWRLPLVSVSRFPLRDPMAISSAGASCSSTSTSGSAPRRRSARASAI